jgi:hypothetical protein
VNSRRIYSVGQNRYTLERAHELDARLTPSRDRAPRRPVRRRALRPGVHPAGTTGLRSPDLSLVFLGDDEAARATEVVGVETEPDANGEGHLRVIHAMALREKYRRRYEEAKRWRV